MQKKEDIVIQTRGFLLENLLFLRPDLDLQDDTPLLKAGVVDSMGVVEIVEFIQETFGVSVADDEISEENLGCLDAVGHFVASKKLGNLPRQDEE